MDCKNSALYIRTSTSYQHNGAEAQLRKLKSYCEAKGIKEIKIYEDKDQSGKNTNRPALTRLLEDVKKNKVDRVITYSLTRIGRSTKDLLEISDLFETKDVAFISLSESIDTSTPAGRLFYTILSAFSQFEREVISERVKVGMANAKAKGKQIGRKKKRNSELIIKLHNEGYSIRKIAQLTQCSKGSVEAELKSLKMA